MKDVKRATMINAVTLATALKLALLPTLQAATSTMTRHYFRQARIRLHTKLQLNRQLYNGPLGKGWTHNWNMLLFSAPSSASRIANSIGLKQGDGNVVYFRHSNGIYYPDASSGEDIIHHIHQRHIHSDRKEWTTYNLQSFTHGKLTSIKDRNGNNTTTLSYNGNDLSGITDNRPIRKNNISHNHRQWENNINHRP